MKKKLEQKFVHTIIGDKVETPLGLGVIVLIIEEQGEKLAYIELDSGKNQDSVAIHSTNGMQYCNIFNLKDIDERENQSLIKNLLNFNNLKPCPFCGKGNSSVDLYENAYGFYQVGCGACGTQSGMSKNYEQVIQRWNSRPNEK